MDKIKPCFMKILPCVLLVFHLAQFKVQAYCNVHKNGVEISLVNGTDCPHRAYKGTRFPNIEDLFGVKAEKVEKIYIQHTDIESINCTVMSMLTNLKRLEISSNSKLKYIPPKCFSGNSKLFQIILNNNALENISTAFEGAFKRDLEGEMYLEKNNLQKFPKFLTPAIGLLKLYLNNNPIYKISQKDLKNLPKLSILSLKGISISTIPDNTFNSSKNLHKLDLSNCIHLKKIERHAFVGAEKLADLTLDNTAIRDIPSLGLNRLKFLSLKGMDNLWEISDDVANLPKLKTVNVPEERRFLCCAFEYKRGNALYQATNRVTNVTRNCSTRVPKTAKVTTVVSPTHHTSSTLKSTKTNPWNQTTASQSRSTTESPWGFGSWGRRKRSLLWFGGDGFVPSNKTTPPPKSTDGFGGGGGKWLPSVSPAVTMFHCEEDNKTDPARSNLHPVECFPRPDLLRPCDNIMGDIYLTALSWFVSFLAILTNASVFAVMIISRRSFSVSNFLITNLSFSDLCLGLYLFILVCASAATNGSYYNHVLSWQFKGGCNVTGFLAIFSSQLSMLILTIITVERYLAIVYAMHLQRRLGMSAARFLVIGSWIISIVLGILPLLGLNSYEEVAICLPFKTESKGDFIYLGAILLLDTVLFFIILVCYGKMYWVVHSPRNRGDSSSNDSSVAIRMALLIFTDFACWMPIAVLGIISATGYSDAIGMTVRKAKYLLVIFFPINSICNPFLYALSTKYFRREFFSVLRQCGLCEKRVSEYNSSYSRSRGKGRRQSHGISETFSSELHQSPSLLVKVFNSFTSRRPSASRSDSMNGKMNIPCNNGHIRLTSVSNISEPESPNPSPSINKKDRDVSPLENCKDFNRNMVVRFTDEEATKAVKPDEEVFDKTDKFFDKTEFGDKNMDNCTSPPRELLRPISKTSTISGFSTCDDTANLIRQYSHEAGKQIMQTVIEDYKYMLKDSLQNSKETKL